MKILGSVLALMVAGALATQAEAAPRKKKPASARKSGEAAMRELERRGFLEDAAARRAFEDGDRPVTRYDMAVVVNRALEILGRARGSGRITYRDEVTSSDLRDEMTHDIRSLAERVEGLTDRSQQLSEQIRELRERRRR